MLSSFSRFLPPTVAYPPRHASSSFLWTTSHISLITRLSGPTHGQGDTLVAPPHHQPTTSATPKNINHNFDTMPPSPALGCLAPPASATDLLTSSHWNLSPLNGVRVSDNDIEGESEVPVRSCVLLKILVQIYKIIDCV
jgi:hypothetical protein